MKIAVICDCLGKENNGTTIATMNLIRSLIAKGHDVNVVCPDADKKDLPNYYVVEQRNLGIFNNYIEKNGVALAKANKKIIYEAIKDVDVIHIQVPFTLGRCAVKLARKLGKPVTASFHCQAENFSNHVFMMNNSFFNNLIYRRFYNKVYKYVDCIHYPTEFICDVFEKRVGKTNHYCISNGVHKYFVKNNAQKPQELADKIVILFTGRLSKEKSHKVLIEGASLSKYADKIQLIFAGDGPQKEHIIDFAKEKLVNLPIINFFSRTDLIDVINYADLYVHPAEIEIEAIACLEAIACGTVPVISNSPRSATKYFAIGPNNLFECNNPVDLANKIDYWIDNPDEKQKCSNEYLGYAKKFDFDMCMDKMEQMLKDAIKMHNK